MMQTLATIEQAETKVKEVMPHVQEALEEAQQFTVILPEHYEEAGQRSARYKAAAKNWHEFRLSITRIFDEGKQKVMRIMNPVEELYLKLADTYGDKALTFKEEQQRIAAEEEKAARAAAAREQRKLDAEAERKAERLEEQGKHDEADAVRESTPQIPMPIVSPDVPKVKGFTTRQYWKWRCRVPGCGRKDCIHMIKALVQAGEAAYGYLAVNQVAINRTVEGQKELANIPGAEIYPDERPAGTGRR